MSEAHLVQLALDIVEEMLIISVMPVHKSGYALVGKRAKIHCRNAL